MTGRAKRKTRRYVNSTECAGRIITHECWATKMSLSYEEARAVPSTSSVSGPVLLWAWQYMVTLVFKVYFLCSTPCKWQPMACGVQAEKEQPALSVGEGLSERGTFLACLHTAGPLCSVLFLQSYTSIWYIFTMHAMSEIHRKSDLSVSVPKSVAYYWSLMNG